MESRQRVPQRSWIPPYAAERLWGLAKERGEHPAETASYLLLQQLYPNHHIRRRLLRLWRREVWGHLGRGRSERAA